MRASRSSPRTQLDRHPTSRRARGGAAAQGQRPAQAAGGTLVGRKGEHASGGAHVAAWPRFGRVECRLGLPAHTAPCKRRRRRRQGATTSRSEFDCLLSRQRREASPARACGRAACSWGAGDATTGCMRTRRSAPSPALSMGYTPGLHIGLCIGGGTGLSMGYIHGKLHIAKVSGGARAPVAPVT